MYLQYLDKSTVCRERVASLKPFCHESWRPIDLVIYSELKASLYNQRLLWQMNSSANSSKFEMFLDPIMPPLTFHQHQLTSYWIYFVFLPLTRMKSKALKCFVWAFCRPILLFTFGLRVNWMLSCFPRVQDNFEEIFCLSCRNLTLKIKPRRNDVEFARS